MIVVNDRGKAFFVRVVFVGDRYGVDDMLVHVSKRGDPMIEFYDYSHTETFGPRGQFVSRYNASTLAQHETSGAGLSLDGGSPDWSIDGLTLAPVIETAKRIAPRKVAP